MVLTKQRLTRDPDKFPTAQLFLLAIVRLAEPIALTSIYPYAWALIKKFEVGDAKDASFYAGLLISAFALAEAVTGMFWGSLSDRVGRKPVLLVGCFGTMLSLILVGFSTNIWMALIGRTMGGLLNGNIGIIQSVVGELVTKPEHEPRAYSVMPFVWSIGTIIGPVIGGTFADPANAFPNYFSEDGLFGRFPYLLPNLICAAMLAVSIVAGYFLLEETHPDMQPRVSMPKDTYVSDETPLMATADAIKIPAIDLRAETYGTFNGSAEHDAERWRTRGDKEPLIVFTSRVKALLIALGIFTYHSMTFDHLLPIFLEDDVNTFSKSLLTTAVSPEFSASTSGGLGLSMGSVGLIMSVNGVLALIVQAVIFPALATYLGVNRLFIVITVLQPIPYLLMPILPYLPSSYIYAGIYTCLAVRNILQIIAYPLLLILTKEATPSPSVLGKVNGASASVGAACRTVAPPIAGLLYGLGTQLDFTAIAWLGSAIVGAVGSVQVFWIVRDKKPLDDNEWVGEDGKATRWSVASTEVSSPCDSEGESDDERDGLMSGQREPQTEEQSN